MEIVLVKATAPDDHDRTYVSRAGKSERVPVHPVHDLPHLVVESLFDIEDGLWAELAQPGGTLCLEWPLPRSFFDPHVPPP